MKLYTIGFTQKTARQFFELLKENNVQRVVDIRLRAGGQLSGFAKQEDLRYFLKELNNCDYVHLEQLAPSEEILNAYRSDKDRAKWEAAYIRLLDQRNIPASLERSLFTEKICCLLCSEAKADHCHRRLAAERLARDWGDITIHHL